MELKAKAGEIKDVISSVNDISTDAEMTVDTDGITIIAIDPAAAIRTSIEIEPDFFDTYDVDEKESMEMDASIFADALRKINKDDDLTLTVEDDGSKVKLSTDNSTFKLNLVDNLDLMEVNLDELEDGFKTEGTITVEALNRAVSSANMFDSTVTMEADGDGLTISASGTMGSTEQNVYLKGGTGEAKSMYADDYLSKLTASGKRIGDTIDIKMGTDFPLRADFKGDNITGIYLVAPRIEED